MSRRLGGFSEEAWERSLESLPGGPDAPEVPEPVVFCDKGDRWHDAKTGRIISDEKAKQLQADAEPDGPDPDDYYDRRRNGE